MPHYTSVGESLRGIRDNLDLRILKLKLSRIDYFLIFYLKTLEAMTLTPFPLGELQRNKR